MGRFFGPLRSCWARATCLPQAGHGLKAHRRHTRFVCAEPGRKGATKTENVMAQSIATPNFALPAPRHFPAESKTLRVLAPRQGALKRSQTGAPNALPCAGVEGGVPKTLRILGRLIDTAKRLEIGVSHRKQRIGHTPNRYSHARITPIPSGVSPRQGALVRSRNGAPQTLRVLGPLPETVNRVEAHATYRKQTVAGASTRNVPAHRFARSLGVGRGSQSAVAGEWRRTARCMPMPPKMKLRASICWYPALASIEESSLMETKVRSEAGM